ncbi:hypothetical protein FS837_000673 [Tulasnella sp. UAMH 9824]|nr:hypothetical protein FS837_000673 [Tulasnella sp. UAMH 9824]
MGLPRSSLAQPPSPIPPCGTFVELPEEGQDLSCLKAKLGDLYIASERLTAMKMPVTISESYSITFLKPEKTPKSSQIPFYTITSEGLKRIAEALKLWKGLKHPNLLELLGCSLDRYGNIDQLIFPNLTHGNIREFLAKAPVELAQRIGFLQILIDDHLTAVLSGFELPELYEDYPNLPADEFMSPEVILEERIGNRPSDILTNIRPFQGSGAIWHSMVDCRAPGPTDLLLDLVPAAPKPEYASTLRLLHSYLPLCWEYEPMNRPQISLLRRHVFMFSFEDEAGSSVVTTLVNLAYLFISPDRIRLLERSELGSGNYGDVVTGVLTETSSNSRIVAVKKLKASGTRVERVRLVKRLARELNVWAKIKHTNVVELIGYSLDERYDYPLLISVLMPHGNVLGYIKRFKPGIMQRLAFVLTNIFPYPDAAGDQQICMAIVMKQSPGDVELLYPNNFRFEEKDPSSALTLQFLHTSLPECWDFEPQDRPTMSTLLLHISNPSAWIDWWASKKKDPSHNDPKEGKMAMKALKAPLGGPFAHAESAQCADWVGVQTSTASEDSLEQKEGSLYSSSDADHGSDDDDDLGVRSGGEDSSDGWVGVEEDEEREEVSALASNVKPTTVDAKL